MSISFDGIMGRVAARVMVESNREAEEEAIEILSPLPTDAVLVIGFGPGVGIRCLAERLPAGSILGVDPSGVMLKAATRRNRAAINAGRVRLEQTTLAELEETPGHFDSAIAVNALQLCEPPVAAAEKLALLLRPGGRLVSLTHDWAMKKHAGSVERWIASYRDAFAASGFVAIETWRARAEKGGSVAFVASRPIRPEGSR